MFSVDIRQARIARFAAIIGFVAFVACDGCGDEPTKNNSAGAAALTVSPINQDFGALGIGDASEPVVFTVTNDGEAASSSIATDLIGDHTDDFEVTADGCSGETLDPDASCEISVTFTPTVTGDRSAELEIDATDGGTITAALSGSGSAPGELQVTPTPHNFGTVVVGELSDAVEFTVTNAGGGETGELTANLDAGDAGEFVISDDTCSGTTLASEGTCTISVAFEPTSIGMMSTTLRIAGGAEDGIAEAALSGTAVGAPELAIDPAPRDFGSVATGFASPDVTFTVSNAGGVDSGMITTTISGDADFVSVSDTCDGQTLAGRAACEVVVRFEPTAEGPRSATLEVTASPGGTVGSDLTGIGLAPGSVEVTPSTNDLGTAVVGATGMSAVLTVTNNGGADTGALDVTLVGANPNDFAFVSGANTCQGVTLAAAADCTVEVVFAPTATGQRDATVSVSGTPGGTATAAVTGVGASPATLEIAPLTQGFGTVAVNATSAAVTFTITNTGTQGSGIPSVSLGGASPGEFNIVADGCTAALAPTATCTVDVEFAPTAAGAATADLIATAMPGGTATAALDGTGILATDLTTSTSVVTFGDVVNGGSSTTQTIVVSNNGAQSGVISVTPTGEFNIVADTCTGVQLDLGSNCTITLEFAPTIVGSATGSVAISATPGGTLQVSLGGTSLPEFTFAPATPDPYDYGSFLIGNASPPTQVFTVTNTAGAGSITRNLTASLVTGTSFNIIANTCDGAAVAAGATCTVEVDFDPVSPPGQKPESISVVDQSLVTLTRALVGTALSNTPLDISPTSHVFANQAANTTATVTFTVTNTTNAPTGPLRTNFNAAGRPFGIVSDTCAGNTLDAFGGANDACEIVVIFYPTTTGNFAGASLNVQSPTDNTLTVPLSGNAIAGPTIVVDPTVVPASMIATQTWQRTFNVRNAGALVSGMVTVGLTGSSIFGITANTCTGTLAPAASCTVTVTATTTTADALGAHGGTLFANATPGGSSSVDFTTNISELLSIVGPASPYAFADTIVGGASPSIAFTVHNNSSTPVTSPAVATTGPYRIVSNSCPTVPANANCGVTLAFEPTVAGVDQAGTLSVGSGLSGTAVWDLIGDSPADAALTWELAQTDFGYTTVGQTGLTRTFVLRNTGGLATATVPAFAFNPNTNPQFTIDSSDCAASLAVDASCDVIATFEPTVTGPISLTITASADGQSGATLSAPLALTAEGRAATNFSLSPQSYQFAETPIPGDTSTETVTYTLTNNTGGNVNNPTLQISNADFSIVAGQDNCTGQNLNNGQTCTFQVEFTPGTAGDKSAIVTARRGGTRDSATVFGTSVSAPALQFSAGDPAFGPSQVVVATTETFTLTNTGGQAIASIASTIGGLNAGQFTIITDGCAGGLAAGASCDLVVEFLPLAIASYSATLTSTPNVGTGASLNLSGAGAAGAGFVLTPAGPVDCGDAVPAETSVDCTLFTVTNGGGVTSADFDISLTSVNEFAITSTTCATTGSTPEYAAIAPGASCDVTVTYAPLSPSASDSNTLLVTGGSSSASTTLTGDATAAMTTPASASTQSFTAAIDGSDSLTFTYTNAAGTPATAPLNVTVTGTNASDFAAAGDCAGAILAAGATCTVTVVFTPTVVASGRTAVLNVGDGTTNKTAAAVDLSGTGTN